MKIFKEILIIKLSSIGDICHSSLLLSGLRKKFPNANITWVVEENFKLVIMQFADVNKIITVNLKHPVKNLRLNIKNIIQLRKKKYDVVLDLHGLLKSGILTMLSRSNYKIGFRSPISREFSQFFYHKTFPPFKNHTINIAELNLELINHFLFVKCKLEPPKIKYNLKENILKQKKFKNIKLKIGINPWASFHTKSIPEVVVETWSKKINNTFKVKPILIYGKQNFEQAKNMAKKYNLILAPQVNLEGLFNLIKELDFYLGTDSGPSYISQLVGTKSLILFGPTNLNRQLPIIKNKSKKYFFLGVYSNYYCPIIHEEPISNAYRCLNKNCKNNLCMKQFDSSELIRIIKRNI